MKNKKNDEWKISGIDSASASWWNNPPAPQDSICTLDIKRMRELYNSCTNLSCSDISLTIDLNAFAFAVGVDVGELVMCVREQFDTNWVNRG